MAQAAAEEEEEYTDYSPTVARKGKAAGPKKNKPAQAGGPSQPRKKAGGPCAMCYATGKLLRTASLMCIACDVQFTRSISHSVQQGQGTHASLTCFLS